MALKWDYYIKHCLQVWLSQCYRHDDAQQGEDEVHGPVRGAGVEGVARPVIETPGVTIILQYI